MSDMPKYKKAIWKNGLYHKGREKGGSHQPEPSTAPDNIFSTKNILIFLHKKYIVVLISTSNEYLQYILLWKNKKNISNFGLKSALSEVVPRFFWRHIRKNITWTTPLIQSHDIHCLIWSFYVHRYGLKNCL